MGLIWSEHQWARVRPREKAALPENCSCVRRMQSPALQELTSCSASSSFDRGLFVAHPPSSHSGCTAWSGSPAPVQAADGEGKPLFSHNWAATGLFARGLPHSLAKEEEKIPAAFCFSTKSPLIPQCDTKNSPDTLSSESRISSRSRAANLEFRGADTEGAVIPKGRKG